MPDQDEWMNGSRCRAKTTHDGEPGISVRDHCLNVGRVAEALVERLSPMLACKLPASIITLSAAHDVGKLSPGFQAKCASWIVRNNLISVARQENWANCEPDHARVSQWCLQNIFADERLSEWAAIVGAHLDRIKGNQCFPHPRGHGPVSYQNNVEMMLNSGSAHEGWPAKLVLVEVVIRLPHLRAVGSDGPAVARHSRPMRDRPWVIRVAPPIAQRTTSHENSVEHVRGKIANFGKQWESIETRVNEIIDSLWKENQVAKLLNCSRRHVGNLRARGAIRFLRVGGTVRFIPKHVQEDIRRLEIRSKHR
jgi:excisionase family DNA binding protein